MAERFLLTLRRLATAYQAFAAYSAAHIRTLDLTPPQFDVIATLGGKPGMTCRELGEQTLITKGTLTGMLDRLEARGLIRRDAVENDRRSVFVGLTPAGERLHARIFPEHVRHLRTCFAGLDSRELRQLDDLLERLAAGFAPPTEGDADVAASPKTRMIAAARRGQQTGHPR